MLIMFSILMLWGVCGMLFGIYILHTKNISNMSEISSNVFKRGLVLFLTGPVFILAILVVWIENKLSLPLRKFINWLLD